MAADHVPTGSRLLTYTVRNVESDEEFDQLVDSITDTLYADERTADLGPAVGSSTRHRTIEVIYTPVLDSRAAASAARERIRNTLAGLIRPCTDVDSEIIVPASQNLPA